MNTTASISAFDPMSHIAAKMMTARKTMINSLIRVAKASAAGVRRLNRVVRGAFGGSAGAARAAGLHSESP